MCKSGCARRPSSGPSGFYPLRPFASRLRRSSSRMTPQTLWPPRSMGPHAKLTHSCPRPPGKPRAAPGFALALRAIRLPDACERLTPLVVLFGMWVVFRVVLIRGCPDARGGVRVLLLVVWVLYLLGIWRPSIWIPAVAENGNINVPEAARRSLSGTHFARKGSAARVGMTGVAAPPGRTARRLAGSLWLPCAVGAESQ